VAAFKSINSLPADPKITNFKLDFLVRPGYPKAIENAVRLQLNNVLSRFSRLLDQPTTAKIIMITEKDRLWVRNELPKIVPQTNMVDIFLRLILTERKKASTLLQVLVVELQDIRLQRDLLST
jgi:hypothetical protein